MEATLPTGLDAALETQIQEARRRAEIFSQSLAEAREQEAKALKVLEDERARWTASLEDKRFEFEELKTDLSTLLSGPQKETTGVEQTVRNEDNANGSVLPNTGSPSIEVTVSESRSSDVETADASAKIAIMQTKIDCLNDEKAMLQSELDRTQGLLKTTEANVERLEKRLAANMASVDISAPEVGDVGHRTEIAALKQSFELKLEIAEQEFKAQMASADEVTLQLRSRVLELDRKYRETAARAESLQENANIEARALLEAEGNTSSENVFLEHSREISTTGNGSYGDDYDVRLRRIMQESVERRAKARCTGDVKMGSQIVLTEDMDHSNLCEDSEIMPKIDYSEVNFVGDNKILSKRSKKGKIKRDSHRNMNTGNKDVFMLPAKRGNEIRGDVSGSGSFSGLRLSQQSRGSSSDAVRTSSAAPRQSNNASFRSETSTPSSMQAKQTKSSFRYKLQSESTQRQARMSMKAPTPNRHQPIRSASTGGSSYTRAADVYSPPKSRPAFASRPAKTTLNNASKIRKTILPSSNRHVGGTFVRSEARNTRATSHKASTVSLTKATDLSKESSTPHRKQHHISDPNESITTHVKHSKIARDAERSTKGSPFVAVRSEAYKSTEDIENQKRAVSDFKVTLNSSIASISSADVGSIRSSGSGRRRSRYSEATISSRIATRLQHTNAGAGSDAPKVPPFAVRNARNANFSAEETSKKSIKVVIPASPVADLHTEMDSVTHRHQHRHLSEHECALGDGIRLDSPSESPYRKQGQGGLHTTPGVSTGTGTITRRLGTASATRKKSSKSSGKGHVGNGMRPARYSKTKN